MLENVVHPCREDYLLIVVSTVTDIQTYILFLYNYKRILEICGSGIAFSQGVEEGSLGINVTTCLLIKLLFFTLLHAARGSELLEDTSLRQARRSPSILAFCSSLHRYKPSI